ncbi:type III pantothenate kinase [Candidatus Pelagibacter sp.]|nr:type III pantothenate kinase [Candidatus Pelagibacter sp.]
MYLIGDIGNTAIKICLFDDNLKLIKNIKILRKNLNKKFLMKELLFLKQYNSKLKKVLFSSVVPSSYKIIKKNIKEITKLNCKELKSCNLTKFINIRVNRKQIGSDRLANAIGVIDSKHNYIVVDFGTATNFDIVIKKDYIGGVLAPGVELSLKNLADKASLIPKIKLEKTAKVIGKNTKSAVRAGFYHGYTGLIDNIIKLILKQTRKKFKIILTGGFAHLFKSSIKGIKTVDKNLTIKGILKVAID